MILWDASLEVYDWLYVIICHLHVDYMSLDYIFVF